MKTLVDKLVDREDLSFSPPQLGCVLYLSGLPGGGNKIYDRSSYGNHGSITGATWTKLPSGIWCLSFDGTDDCVDCGNSASLDLTNMIVFEAWVNLDTLAQDAYLLDQSVPSASGKWPIGLYNSSDRIFVGIPASMMGLIGISSYLTAGQYQHWVVVYDIANATFNFYLNGVEKSLSDVGNYYTGGTLEHLAIGARLDTGGPASGLAGDIAMVRIYNRRLSTLEIQNHFNQEKHLFGVW